MSKTIMKQDVLDFHLILSESACLIKTDSFQTWTLYGFDSIQPRDVLKLKPKEKDSVCHVDKDRNDRRQALQEDNSEDEDLSDVTCWSTIEHIVKEGKKSAGINCYHD